MKAGFVYESLVRHDLSTQNLLWSPESKTFSAEISELPRDFELKSSLVVVNPKTRNTRTFNHYKTDMDATHEDTYGWRYRSDDGLELLIIND